MTRGGPSAWLLPRLLLVSLFAALARARAEAVQVQAPAQQDGFLGTTATLRCSLPQLELGAHVMQMMWLRREPVGELLRVAAFHPSRGASYLEPERMEFVAARPGAELRNASLAVRAVRADDEGNYTCMFATFPQGSGSADTRLRVLAQPQNQAKALEIMLSPEPVPVARCVSVGGRPPARISWSSDLGGKPNNSQVPGPLPGTVTVTSLFTLLPSSQVDGENITCRVEQEGFKEHVLLPVTLTVLYPPEVSISGYNDDWYIGLSEATLNCNIRSNPKPMVCNWTTVMGPLPPPAMAQGPQLLIRNVDESINTTFICSVTNAIGTSKAELTVLVRVREQSHLAPSAGIIAMVVVALLFVAALLGGGLLYFLTHDCPAVSYSGVASQDSSIQ